MDNKGGHTTLTKCFTWNHKINMIHFWTFFFKWNDNEFFLYISSGNRKTKVKLCQKSDFYSNIINICSMLTPMIQLQETTTFIIYLTFIWYFLFNVFYIIYRTVINIFLCILNGIKISICPQNKAPSLSTSSFVVFGSLK